MKYNELGKSGIKVSEIGIGCEFLEGKDYEIVKSTLDAAFDAGINILDCFMSESKVRSDIGRALEGRRDKMIIQGHLRAIWKEGQYGRTHNMDETKYFFEDLMSRLRTDYIDIGMIHMIDNIDDYNEVFDGELIKYAKTLKGDGTIRLIGLSSHDATIALKAVKTGLIDVLLFSINPAYDLISSHVDYPQNLTNDYFDNIEVHGIHPEREELYKTCEAMGVGITVMKSLAAGALLNEKTSPFGGAFTPGQCIHYALNRPGVASVLVGMKSVDEVVESIKYETMSDSEKDYTHLLKSKPKFSLEGQCVYCNHCLPCPVSINIATVNKYLDMAQMIEEVSPTVRAHYESLEHKAEECIECGICEERCPFGVKVIEKMHQAAELFA